MVVDAHTHLGEGNDKIWTLEDLESSMTNANIDMSIIIADRTSGEISTTENLLKLTKNNSRFKLIADFAYSNLEGNEIGKLVDVLKKENACAVKFYPGYENYYPYSDELIPLYKYCQENNIPAVFHTGVLQTGSKGDLRQSHPLNIDSVANNFPDLKIVMAHMGNPWLMDCAAVIAKNENVYADISGYFMEFQAISEREKRLFVRQLTDLQTYLGDLNKFIFGTDWPLYSQKEYLEAFSEISLTDEERELVMWQNANHVYSLGL